MLNRSSEELIEEFPFLKASQDDPWCYGNCEGDNWFYECPEGWHEIFYDLLRKINEILKRENGSLQVHQIKEKFGGLRFYYGLEGCSKEACQEIHNLVNLTEHLSYKTCILCSKPTKYRTTGWILYICEECADRIGKDKCLLVNNEGSN